VAGHWRGLVGNSPADAFMRCCESGVNWCVHRWKGAERGLRVVPRASKRRRGGVRGTSRVVKSGQEWSRPPYQNVLTASCPAARRKGKCIKVREARCCSSINLSSFSTPPKCTAKTPPLALSLHEPSHKRLTKTTMAQHKTRETAVSDLYLVCGAILAS
jgi:hypothetical protein